MTRLVHRAEGTVVACRPIGLGRMGTVAARAHVGGARVAVVRARPGAVREDTAPHGITGVGRAFPPVVADARAARLAGARPVAAVPDRAGVVVAAGGPRPSGGVRLAARRRIAGVERAGVVVAAVERHAGQASPVRALLVAVAHVAVGTRGPVGHRHVAAAERRGARVARAHVRVVAVLDLAEHRAAVTALRRADSVAGLRELDDAVATRGTRDEAPRLRGARAGGHRREARRRRHAAADRRRLAARIHEAVDTVRRGGSAGGGRIDVPEDRQLLPRGEVILATLGSASQETSRRRERDVTGAQVGEAARTAAEADAAASASHVDHVLDREIATALLASHHDQPSPEPSDRPTARIDGSGQGHVAPRVELGEVAPEAAGGVEHARARHVEERIHQQATTAAHVPARSRGHDGPRCHVDRAARDEGEVAPSPIRHVALGEHVGGDVQIAEAGFEAPEATAAAARSDRGPATVLGDRSEDLQLCPGNDPYASAAPRIAGRVGVDLACDGVRARFHVERATVAAHEID